MSGARLRVLLGDDHRMVAEGLKSLLAADFDLVEVVGDGAALIKAAARQNPDVIVADIAMPKLSGLEALDILKRRNPAVKLIFLTMHLDSGYVRKARESGASGYVLKHAAPEELVQAIRRVGDGMTYFSAELDAGTGHGGQEAIPQPDALTPRQREILALLSSGHTTKQIGKMLGISPRTVEFHKYRAMESHGFKTVAELIHFAIRQGMAD